MMKTCHCIDYFVKKCFYCGKNHQLGQKYISVDVCTIYKKSWCYFLNKCKNESMAMVCVDCNKEEEKDATIDKDMPRPSLSPITTKCDKDKVLQIHSIIPSLIDL